MHAGTKPHKCLTCNKNFSQASHLREHQRIHSGDKPFRCRICKKSFRRADVLRAHEKIHKETGEEIGEMIEQEKESSESESSDDDKFTMKKSHIRKQSSSQAIKNENKHHRGKSKELKSDKSNRPQIINVENLGTTSQYQDIVDAIRSKDVKAMGSNSIIKQ